MADQTFPITVQINARPEWNDTGITLKAGQRYQFTASGTWKDAWNSCGPDGYPSNSTVLRLSEKYRRVADRNWFMLCGSLDKDTALIFPIGSSFSPPPFERDGVLTCFANDISYMYWNNCGSVALTISLKD